MNYRVPALMMTLMLAAAPASAFTPERAGLLVDAIRANDCAMHGDEAGAALGPLGLEPVEVQAFVDTLYGAGLVTLSEDMATLRLAPMLCEAEAEASMAMIVEAFAAQEPSIEPWLPEFTPARGAELIAAIRAEDCTLSDARAQEMLPGLGFTPIETRDIVAVLVDGEMAGVNDDGSELVLADATCDSTPEADAEALAALIDSWAERHPTPEVVIEQGVTE
ncbi:hypothetical protein [Pararhodobacter sp. CCB-MM2]|uniref:hypothetical protein n=1 Tax=Pararhodobacter sp. CCB-MM2 TaxID=1786003 RepID=UPI00082D6498|nr:hypothetical protein [Pararhodobacter sp. CCB-MM2]MCA2010916.1 hypothetical protein [Cereibacter sphaeroides]